MTAQPPDEQPTMAPGGLTDWVIREGLRGTAFDLLLEQCCTRLVAAGIPISRAHITMRAHHPEIGSVAFRWQHDTGRQRDQFERSTADPTSWLQSPFYYLAVNEISELRQNLAAPAPAFDFPFFDDLRQMGATDYIAFKRDFLSDDDARAAKLTISDEGALMSFATTHPAGFSDAHLDSLRAFLPGLCLALKSGSNRRMAEDITATYLGADAGRRVLSGDIVRGSSETISAVIWYFDLQGFTTLSETLAGADIIELLNDYFGEVVDLIEASGGNVLKFMGDGLLAIFPMGEATDSYAEAVEAASRMPGLIEAINNRRARDGLQVTGFTLALHAGDVFYGNIGGKHRLDFTVIGPAVNTTARVLGMCPLVGQSVILTEKVAEAVRAARTDVVSLGQYRLRGVTDRLELFTLD